MASVFPGRLVTTEELAARCGRDPADAVRKTGIRTRWLAADDERFVDVGARALRAALDDAGLPASALARVIFVTTGVGDHVAPANANQVALLAGVRRGTPCFDLQNGCVGFLNALDLAARFLATGEGSTAIVVVEFPARYARPEDHRPYLVVGDAAVAAIVGPAERDEGLLATFFANDGGAFDGTGIPHGSFLEERTWIRFGSPSRQMTEAAIAALRAGTDAVCARSGVPLEAVDWVLPHQPNGSMVRAILADFGVGNDRTCNVVEDLGSIGAASIPASLDRLRRSGRLRPGQHVLLVGVGVGVSYGAIMLRVAS